MKHTELKLFWPFPRGSAKPSIPTGVYRRYSAYWVGTPHGATTLVPGDYVASYPNGTHTVQSSGFRGAIEVPQ